MIRIRIVMRKIHFAVSICFTHENNINDKAFKFLIRWNVQNGQIMPYNERSTVFEPSISYDNHFGIRVHIRMR